MAISAPEPLSAAHDLSDFDCGKPVLDRWLKERALKNQERGFTAVMVVHEEGRVVGYYGLAPSVVTPDALPRAVRTGQPPNPIPCLLLGQLAVDQRWGSAGLGSALLTHALRRCVDVATLIGGRVVVVRAVDVHAIEFWRRQGFRMSDEDPTMLYRPMADIAALFS